MAKVVALKNSQDWERKPGEDFESWLKRQDGLFKALETEGERSQVVVGKVISTPVADGYANYLVLSAKPLHLGHIPYMDAWHADSIWLRGLRLRDVEAMVVRDCGLRSMFGDRDATAPLNA